MQSDRGKPKPRCTGHRKNGSACRAWPITGADKCRMHVGKKAAQVVAKAKDDQAEARVEAKARKAVVTYGLPVETTAIDAILNDVKVTAGHVAWLRGKVAALTEDKLVWGRTKEVTGGRDEGVTDEAKPNIFLKLYQEERTHLLRVCAEAVRLGIEERRVRLAEQQGRLVADVIRGILEDLHLTEEQLELVPQIVPKHLRLLAGIATA